MTNEIDENNGEKEQRRPTFMGKPVDHERDIIVDDLIGKGILVIIGLSLLSTCIGAMS